MVTQSSKESLAAQPYVLWLDTATARDFLAIGYKGLNLALTQRLKVPVPPTFCITSQAYRSFLESFGTHLDALNRLSLPELIEYGRAVQQNLFKRHLPVQIAAAIRNAYRQLAGDSEKPVVLRPSVVYEAPLAFAKRLRPMLNVSGMIEFEKAIKICWAFMWSEELIRYRFAQHLNQRFDEMAVLVQEQLPAVASGTLLTFYLHPDRTQQMVIESAFGLNEAVSRGMLVPDHVVWDRVLQQVTTQQTATKPFQLSAGSNYNLAEQPLNSDMQISPTLNASEIRQLVKMAEKTLGLYHHPLEIEWIKTPDYLTVVQVTPVLKVEPPAAAYEDKDLSQFLFPPYFEKPVSPLCLSLMPALLDEAFRGALKACKLPVEDLGETPLFHVDNYYLHLSQSVMDFLQQQQDLLLEDFNETPWRFVFRMLVEITRLRFYWQPRYRQYVKMVKELWGFDYDNTTQERLLEQIEKIVTASRLLLETALVVRWTHVFLQAFLKKYMEPYIDPEDIQAYTQTLFTALPNRLNQTAQALENLLIMAHKMPEVSHILKTTPLPELMNRLEIGQSGLQFLQALKAFVGQHGYTKISIDPLHKTWVEDPMVVLHEIQQMFLHNRHFFEEVVVEQREELERQLGSKIMEGNLLEGLAFKYILQLSQGYSGLYQEEPYYLSMYIPLLRRTLLTLSQNLSLNPPEDIFFLKFDEIRKLLQLQQMHHAKTREVIQARKNKFIILSKLCRHQNTTERPLELTGIPAAPGSYLGKVRLISNHSDLKSLQPGEILVVDYLEPDWEEAFERLSGLITDLGGMSCHAATLARKYRIPAVVGTQKATRLLKTGWVVDLNGAKGQVTLYQPGELEPSATVVTG